MMKNKKAAPNGNQPSYQYPMRENARGVIVDDARKVTDWDKVEEYVFYSKVFPFIDHKQQTILDIGAGEGTYSKLFAPYAKELILVEPDKYRLNQAKKLLKNSPVKKQFILQKGEEVKLKDESIDTVICVHLIQHISKNNSNKIFESISKALKPGGRLVLFFSDNSEYQDEFHITWKNRGEPIVTSIPENIFEILTNTEHEGSLQFRSLHKEIIKNELAKLGLVEETSTGYMPVFPSVLKRILGLCAQLIRSPITRHKFLHAINYDNYTDRCFVFRKI